MRDWCGDTRWRRHCHDPAGAGGETEGKGVLLEVGGSFLKRFCGGGGILLSYGSKIGFSDLKKEILACELSLIRSLEARKGKACSENGHPSKEAGTVPIGRLGMRSKSCI